MDPITIKEIPSKEDENEKFISEMVTLQNTVKNKLAGQLAVPVFEDEDEDEEGQVEAKVPEPKKKVTFDLSNIEVRYI